MNICGGRALAADPVPKQLKTTIVLVKIAGKRTLRSASASPACRVTKSPAKNRRHDRNRVIRRAKFAADSAIRHPGFKGSDRPIGRAKSPTPNQPAVSCQRARGLPANDQAVSTCSKARRAQALTRRHACPAIGGRQHDLRAVGTLNLCRIFFPPLTDANPAGPLDSA